MLIKKRHCENSAPQIHFTIGIVSLSMFPHLTRSVTSLSGMSTSQFLRFALRFADCLSYSFHSLRSMWRRIDAIRPSWGLVILAQGCSGVGLPPCLSAFAYFLVQQLPTTPVTIALQSEDSSCQITGLLLMFQYVSGLLSSFR